MIFAKILLGGVIAAIVTLVIILTAYMQGLRAEIREHGADGVGCGGGRMESPAETFRCSPAHRRVRDWPVHHAADFETLKLSESNGLTTPTIVAFMRNRFRIIDSAFAEEARSREQR
jgi:hypothetical protein